MSSCPCPPTPPPLITKKPVMRNMLATQIRGLLVPGVALTFGAVFTMYMVNNRPKYAAYAEYYRVNDMDEIEADIATKGYFASVKTDDGDEKDKKKK